MIQYPLKVMGIIRESSPSPANIDWKRLLSNISHDFLQVCKTNARNDLRREEEKRSHGDERINHSAFQKGCREYEDSLWTERHGLPEREQLPLVAHSREEIILFAVEHEGHSIAQRVEVSVEGEVVEQGTHHYRLLLFHWNGTRSNPEDAPLVFVPTAGSEYLQDNVYSRIRRID